MTTRGAPGAKDLSSVVASIKASWALLGSTAHRRYVRVVAGQMATGLLDLVGIALIGLVGVVGTAAVSGSTAKVPWLPEALQSPGGDPLTTAAVLALAAAAVLLMRSFAYAALLRINYRLLARSQAETVRSLFDGFMRLPITDIQERSSQSIAYALGGGATAAVTGLLGSLSVILTDAALLVLLGVGLFLVDPSTTIVAAAYLAVVALVVHASLSRWSARNGEQLGRAGIGNLVSVQETLGLYRELWAMGRLDRQVADTRQSLESGIDARATQTLIEQIPRVVYDAALVVGALVLAVWQVRMTSVQDAFVTMLLFLAAASRVLPSLMRINGQLIQVRSASAQARPTYELAASIRRDESPLPEQEYEHCLIDGSDKGPLSVQVDGVTFRYPGSSAPAVRDVSIAVAPGELVALAGPTGSGKSTLADLIAGLLPPTTGSVLVGGRPPRIAIHADPGSVAYVPQRVMLIDGTVRANVAIGLARDEVHDDQVWDALRRAHVHRVIKDLPDGLDSRIGEHGLRLSGGQRQRLGLARALFARPRLLILDEATSALDGETEREIAAGIRELHGRITVIVIAHRLAGIRSADRVIYLDDGVVAGQGSFSDVLQASPGFARQVQTMSVSGDPLEGGAA